MSRAPEAPFLSLAVLAYNEEASVEYTLRVCSEVLEGCRRSYELVAVEDGSTDGTPDILARLAAQLPNCRTIRHPRNLGIGAGVRTCYFATHGQWAVWFPADGQADPGELPRLQTHLEGCDVLLTFRDARGRREGRLRKLISGTDRALVRLLFGLKVRDLHWVRFFKREVLRRMVLSTHSPFVDTEMLVCARRAGARVREVPLEDRPRQAGQARGASLGNLAGAVRDLLALRWRGARLAGHEQEALRAFTLNCPWLNERSPRNRP
jgi:dolichol-phosphate mannosyltransferase